MENPTAIFYDERAVAAREVGESLVAHEIAHQWFGDAVTAADWHHVWLSEGVATYLAHLWTEHAHGAAALRAALDDSERWFTGPRTGAADSARAAILSRPVLDTTITDLRALLGPNSYDKAAWVLHGLRSVVGDSAFVRGLRRYLERHRHGTALTSDFAAAMREASGDDVTWYLEQELLQPGIARLEVRWAPRGRAVELEITQVQPAAWGVRRIPGLELGVDGGIVRVDLRERVTRVTLPTPAPPAGVVVDPRQRWLLEATVARR
jgi:aminopeptidase N